MSDERYHNPANRRRWPSTSVLNGWVFFNGTTQMGFSLKNWAPGTERIARSGPESAEMVQGMNFPEGIELWLRGLLVDELIRTVSVQRAESRWRVHLEVALPSENRRRVIEIVQRLYTAANLPWGSDNQHSAEIASIRTSDSELNADDALAQWLGGRIQLAVQHIFTATTAG